MDKLRAPLERIPREIRDKIYQLIFLDPARPILEGNFKSTKYRNYLGLLYVNKLMHMEVKAALEEIKPLIIISCNLPSLGKLMIDHGIPYISDHHIGRVKYHSLRLHVKFPTCKEHSKQLYACVLLSEHLSETCLMLRRQSLAPPNGANSLFTITEDFLFPKVKMAIQLGSVGDVSMLESTQVALLKQMLLLNRTGKINIIGCVNENGKKRFFRGGLANRCAVRAILPGNEGLAPNDTLESDFDSVHQSKISALQQKFITSQITDCKDSVEVASWMNAIAARAYRAHDFSLARYRYSKTLDFIDTSMEPTIGLYMEERKIFQEMDICRSDAEMGAEESAFELGKCARTARYCKHITECLEIRSEYLPQSLLDRAEALKERVREKLGADFEKVGSSNDATANDDEGNPHV